MKIRLKDSLCIMVLLMSGLLTLDVFLSDLQIYPVLDTRLFFSETPLAVPFEPVDFVRQEALSQEDMELAPNYLKLRGTIIGAPSLAFIYNSDAQTRKVYKINDSIDDFKIVNILPAKIMLARNGSNWELLLSGQAAVATGSANYETVVMSRREMISELPRANELLRKIKIIPSLDTDSHKLKGFRIDDIPAGSIIEKAGIKSGDIIHSVQGNVLESTQAAWEIFKYIRHQPQIEVVLLRGNIPITLRYQIRN